jgi:hypothetical protein
MKTSWRRHRPHAVASLVFRSATAAGFGLGLLYALTRTTPATPSCDIEQGACVARLIRYEVLFHVAPPVGGLLAGVVLGSLLVRVVHRHYRTARTA